MHRWASRERLKEKEDGSHKGDIGKSAPRRFSEVKVSRSQVENSFAKVGGAVKRVQKMKPGGDEYNGGEKKD